MSNMETFHIYTNWAHTETADRRTELTRPRRLALALPRRHAPHHRPPHCRTAARCCRRMAAPRRCLTSPRPRWAAPPSHGQEAPCQAAAPHPPFAPCQHVSGHDEPRHHCMAAPHSLAAGCRRARALCRRPAEPLHRTDAPPPHGRRVKPLGWPPPLARALAAPPPPPLCHRRHRHQRRKEKGKRKERKEKRVGIF